MVENNKLRFIRKRKSSLLPSHTESPKLDFLRLFLAP